MRKSAAARQLEAQMTWEDEQRKKNERLEALQKLTIEELKTELEIRSKVLLAAEIENLPSTIKHLVNHNATRLLLATLGFEESFGRWEVKRTNGNVSPIAEAIGGAAIRALQLAIPDFVKEFITDLSKEEYLQNAGRKDYKWQLNRGITDYVSKWIDEESKVQSQRIIETLKGSQEKR